MFFTGPKVRLYCSPLSAGPESETSAALLLEVALPLLLLECCFTILYNSFFMNLDVRLTLQSLSGPFTSQRNEEPPGIQDVLSCFYCLLPGV